MPITEVRILLSPQIPSNAFKSINYEGIFLFSNGLGIQESVYSYIGMGSILSNIPLTSVWKERELAMDTADSQGFFGAENSIELFQHTANK